MASRQDRVTDSFTIGDLLTARRGQAYFSRKLRELDDDALAEPSTLPGWSRAHVIARVGYHARWLANVIGAVGEAAPADRLRDIAEQPLDVEYGATLSPTALRHLSDHAAIHLNVVWRDLDDDRWTEEIALRSGGMLAIRQTPWLRARETWLGAIDLHNGASFDDLPPDVINRVLAEEIESWVSGARRDLPTMRIIVEDYSRELIVPGPESQPAVTVAGAAGDLVQWMTGRGGEGALRHEAWRLPRIR